MVQSQTIDEGGDDFGTGPLSTSQDDRSAPRWRLHLEQVAADLIDNSIDAGASHVEVIPKPRTWGLLGSIQMECKDLKRCSA